jgi:hypothetical protein
MDDGLHILIGNRTICSLSGEEGGLGGEMVEVIKLMYNRSLFRIVTMNPPCTTNIS